MARAAFSLGSNIGDKRAAIANALAGLEAAARTSLRDPATTGRSPGA